MTESGKVRHNNLIQMAGEERRAEIIALYRAGVRQVDIAEQLGIERNTVSRHISKQRQIWLNSALVNFDEAQGRELERIDKIEAEAWEGWERSKKPLMMQVRYMNKKGTMVDQQRQQNRDGDPRFLQVLSWCIEQRCKILGLITSKHEVTHNEGQRIALVEVVKASPENE